MCEQNTIVVILNSPVKTLGIVPRPLQKKPFANGQPPILFHSVIKSIFSITPSLLLEAFITILETKTLKKKW